MRKLTLLGLVVAATLGASTPALAHGGPPVTFTEIAHGVTDIFVAVPPCGDVGPGLATFTFNGVFHVTEFADGHYHVNGNQTGTFTFDPDNPAVPESAGRFSTRFSESGNPGTFTVTDTFSVIGRNVDGSRVRFNVTTHTTIVGEDVVVSFDKVNCG